MLKLNTLFICFYFPPFNRVGSRRWAKHIKYFNKNNQLFHVLAGGFKGASSWDEDVIEFENKITRIPVEIFYPYYKQQLPSHLFEKIKWKINQKYHQFKGKNYAGNYWDDSRTYRDVFS